MNIVLIGMPGCGKSTLGIVLAKMLGMDFLDSDVFIQKNENMKLQDIINEKGNSAFLDIEKDNILKLDVDNTVISTGGSVVLREDSIRHLKKNGKIVFIDVPYEVLTERIFNLETRGIAMEDGQTIKDIYEYRRPLYKKYSDIIHPYENVSQKETLLKLYGSLKGIINE